MKHVVIGLALLAPLADMVHADDAGPAAAGRYDATGIHPFLAFGLTYGGDTVVTAKYQDGSSTDVKAGGLVQLGGGLVWQSATLPLAISGSLHYHVDDAAAKNGTAKFSRVPFELLAYYTGVERWRLGGGVRWVKSAEAILEVDGKKEKLQFDNAKGLVLEAGYAFTPQARLNVRYVKESYCANNYSYNGYGMPVKCTKDIDGSHFGANLSYQF